MHFLIKLRLSDKEEMFECCILAIMLKIDLL